MPTLQSPPSLSLSPARAERCAGTAGRPLSRWGCHGKPGLMQTAAADPASGLMSAGSTSPLAPLPPWHEKGWLAGLLPGCTAELPAGCSVSGEGPGSEGLLAADHSSSSGEADALGPSAPAVAPQGLAAGSSGLGGSSAGSVGRLSPTEHSGCGVERRRCWVPPIAARVLSRDVGVGHRLPLLGAAGVEQSPQDRSPRSPGTSERYSPHKGSAQGARGSHRPARRQRAARSAGLRQPGTPRRAQPRGFLRPGL